MRTKILQRIMLALMTSVILFPMLIVNVDHAQRNGFTLAAAESKKPAKRTRKTPAMRERVYSKLARAQKLADDGNIQESLSILNRMKSRSAQLNSYEKAMMWNFIGFVFYGNENLNGAIDAFENVVAQKNIPESLELSTLFSLAQLAMQSAKYDLTLKYINRWQQLKGGQLNNAALVLKSNAYYAEKNYPAALKAISLVVNQAVKKGKIPKENWLILKRALHYELKQFNQVTVTSEALVRYYAKAKYWTELANMYGEIGETAKQLSIMEAANQQGYVTKKSDVKSLAQLYYFSGAPFKAAELMTLNLKKGVLPKDVATLRFLAQAWITAKNEAKAIPVLIEAAKLSKNGNMDARLTETYIALEQWEKAIYAAKNAQQKGDLDNPGNIHIALGMSYFNLKVFDKAIEQFQLAVKIRKQQKVALQWLQYVRKEKMKEEQLSRRISSVGP